jgi:hypothetical protein
MYQHVNPEYYEKLLEVGAYFTTPRLVNEMDIENDYHILVLLSNFYREALELKQDITKSFFSSAIENSLDFSKELLMKVNFEGADFEYELPVYGYLLERSKYVRKTIFDKNIDVRIIQLLQLRFPYFDVHKALLRNPVPKSNTLAESFFNDFKEEIDIRFVRNFIRELQEKEKSVNIHCIAVIIQNLFKACVTRSNMLNDDAEEFRFQGPFINHFKELMVARGFNVDVS